MTKVCGVLAFHALLAFLRQAKIPADFDVSKGGRVTEKPRCWNVWRIDVSGRWSLDARGASRDGGKALARACLWDALGVGACVVPAGSDPNAPDTLPPDVVAPWHQVGRYVADDVRN